MINYILLIDHITYYFRTIFLLHLLVINIHGEETIFHICFVFSNYCGKLLYVNSKDNICSRERPSRRFSAKVGS